MEFTVKRISAEDTRPLRQQLLRQGMPLDRLLYNGDLQPDTLHVGAFAGDKHIGIATVMCQPPNVSKGVPAVHPFPDEMSAFRLRGMAVTDDAQGHGVGAAMLKVCIGHVAEHEGAFLWCDARIAARDFYAKYDFVIIGDEYMVPDVGPHYFMQRGIAPGDVALLDAYLS
ncbi:MAG: GNAT family N-acetyltransferase [Chloroflexota bacterium]